MNRNKMLEQLSQQDKVWDMVVVGGGATGLGIAVDAASRGYSVALVEMSDFAVSTSSRSTKLIHGGVRYLKNGDVKLVIDALRERGRIKANAPHLVSDQTFVISNYSHWHNFLYFCGLSLYDILSFGYGYGRSKYISAKNIMKRLPTSIKTGLKGGIVYHDGKFDDSRMAINLAQTCVDHGGTVINKMKVVKIIHNENGKVNGIECVDQISGKNYSIKSKSVINACGVLVDDVMSLDIPKHKRMITPSQGVHIVLDQKFLQSDNAIMIPQTSDGRVLFAIPWHNKVVIGTTDIACEKPSIEPIPLKQEIDFILNTASLYMSTPPTYSDILSVFAGQRPLAAPDKEGKSTKEISRSHKIIVSKNNLITITGGKWTSYRIMAKDTIDKAISLNLLEKKTCVTKNLHIHGHQANQDTSNHMYIYGSDKSNIEELIAYNESLGEPLSPKYKYTHAEVVWGVREEMAMNIEDILARRVRLLFIDAKEAISVAPKVAEIMAKELNKDQEWINNEINSFNSLAHNYIAENIIK